jgi:hypothetical protein
MITTNGSGSRIKLLLNDSPVIYKTLGVPFYGKKSDINEFQKIWGQCGSDRMEKTA